MNETCILFDSKKVAAVKLKGFRPISLVTSLYKIIAKTLALRIREVVGDTVTCFQGAFVHGRQNLDLVLVANETANNVRSRKEEGIVFKVDFEKAYDHVSWDFWNLRWRKRFWAKMEELDKGGLFFFFFPETEISIMCKYLKQRGDQHSTKRIQEDYTFMPKKPE